MKVKSVELCLAIREKNAQFCETTAYLVCHVLDIFGVYQIFIVVKTSLGCLSPLRAFGDGRFKLSFDQLNEVEGRMYDLHHQVRKRFIFIFDRFRRPTKLTNLEN